MLHNYFIIGWRNIWKHKLFSIINIFGLSVGIAFTLLISSYVWHEVNVNAGLRNAGNQYIIQSKWKDPNMGYELATVAQMPIALKEQYPQLVANIYHWDGVTTNVSKGDKHFRESIQIGDSTFMDTYGLKLLHGDTHTALNDPFSVVLTEAVAMKYFGKTDAIGQTLTIENFSGQKHDFMVSGVLKKTTKNSITEVNDDNKTNLFLASSAAKYMGRSLTGWSNAAIASFIELKDGVKPEDLNGPMRSLLNKNAPPQITANLTPYLVPLKTYHLDANNGSIRKMLYTLSFISIFILMMAVINFVNICISRSSQRMKEIGVRKVLGGLRKQLIGQFLTESVLMALFATLIALGIYGLVRPYFAHLLDADITGLFSFPSYFYFLPFMLAIFIGVLSGLYPALILSSLKSIDALKNKLGRVKGNVMFRKGLITFQFLTAAIVLIGAIIISEQINLFFSKTLGYDKDYVVYAQLPREWTRAGVQKTENIRYRLAQLPQVSNVSLSWEIPDGNSNTAQTFKMSADSTQSVTASLLLTDNEYAKAYGIPLLAGKFFEPQYVPGDSAKVVINEVQSKALGFNTPQEAVGGQFKAQGMPLLTISGVVGNIQLGTMRTGMQPVVFANVNYIPFYRFFSIRLKPGNMEASIKALQNKWAEVMPGAPFDYNFIDDALKKMYKTEIQLKKAAYLATGLAVLIVMLGVLGLVSLSIQKRTKEIGIRKVLGSSVPNVILLFLKDFLGTVIIAALIACPLAYLMMQQWLNGYASKISITPAPFAIALTTLLILTAILISIQTIKAALANPVKSLRSE